MKARFDRVQQWGGAPVRAIAAVLALVLIAGCGGGGSGEASPDEIAQERMSVKSLDQVRRAAAISREIEERPERAGEILERHDLTREDYDAIMFEISADPMLSEAYEEALANLEAVEP